MFVLNLLHRNRKHLLLLPEPSGYRMKQLYKFRPKCFFYGVLVAAMLCTVTWKTAASGIHSPDFRSPLTVDQRDTIPPLVKTDTSVNKSLRFADTLKLTGRDTTVKPKTDTFSLKFSKDSLEAPLKYAAEDSAVVLIKAKKIILYGKTKTEYKDI